MPISFKRKVLHKNELHFWNVEIFEDYGAGFYKKKNKIISWLTEGWWPFKQASIIKNVKPMGLYR